MRDAGFQEQIIVNEKEDRSGSNQTLEEHLQISGTCWGVPADRQNQVSTVAVCLRVVRFAGNQANVIHT